jgi:hypothetical protein
MATCLDDSRLQAVADGEGTTVENEHARSCDACGASVAARRGALRQFGQMMSAIEVPERLKHRVTSTATRNALERRGATTLRPGRPALRSRPAWVFAGGPIIVLLVVLFGVFSPFDSGTTLNAAEILGRSIQTLEGRGIERLQYELSIEGLSAIPLARGTYRIEQLIDHESGRWRFARYATDGTLLNGIAEDPVAGTRETVIRHDGTTFRLRFDVDAAHRVPLWNLQRRIAESMIRLVQASSSQIVTEEVDGNRRQYVVRLSEAGDSPTSELGPLFDLSRARVVVDAADFHIVEFSAGGTVLGEQLAVGYRLIQRTVTSSGETNFALPYGNGPVIELQGGGSQHVPADVVALLLDALASRR